MSNSLFKSIKIRDVSFRNRIFVAPMCQYSACNGIPTNWHLVHLGSRAVGGAGLVMTEATSVSPEGRISPSDTGLWTDAQTAAFKPIAAFIQEHGAVPAVQLAHAGRKAATAEPWLPNIGSKPLGAKDARGWPLIAPSPLAFAEGYDTPREMTKNDIARVADEFNAAAKRALDAGFQVVEIHMAHGYLLHQFLSPLSNHREDEYGGNLENRMRLPVHIAKSVRDIWPAHLPVFVRISATDWVSGGWDLDQSIALAKKLKSVGIDLIDCSTGGLTATAQIPAAPGFQVPFASAIREHAEIKTGAVGLITEPDQADTIIREDRADVVFLARQMLRDPYWPLHAARALSVDIPWPNQYARAKI